MHLYIHIPFCHEICPYCNFYKHKPGNLANREFVDSILREGKSYLSSIDFSLIKTIYLGGGTPSLLSPSLLRRLCEGILKLVNVDNIEEYTIEANPATFNRNKALLMHDLGINRVSLGVQSFEDNNLKKLGRNHTSKQALNSFNTLRDVGFKNINIDLIFSIPEQTKEQWQNDLNKIKLINPEHVSVYNLTYEEDTEFFERYKKGEFKLNQKLDKSLFYQALDYLELNKFYQYEISNYSRLGYESLHNCSYWKNKDYLGLGPGAVSTINNERWKNISDTSKYIKLIQSNFTVKKEIEKLSKEDLFLEKIALGFRTKKGVKCDLIQNSKNFELFIKEGFIKNNNKYCVLTRKGKALADHIIIDLL